MNHLGANNQSFGHDVNWQQTWIALGGLLLTCDATSTDDADDLECAANLRYITNLILWPRPWYVRCLKFVVCCRWGYDGWCESVIGYNACWLCWLFVMDPLPRGHSSVGKTTYRQVGRWFWLAPPKKKNVTKNTLLIKKKREEKNRADQVVSCNRLPIEKLV